MDFSRLTPEELQTFLQMYEYPEQPSLTVQAAQLFSQLQTTPSRQYPIPVLDLFLATQYLQRGGQLNRTYSEAEIINADPLVLQSFAQVFILPQDTPQLSTRILRILRILGVLEQVTERQTNNLIQRYPIQFRSGSEGSVYVINDGAKFPYGTKQRISKEYVAVKVGEGYREFIYCGPSTAMGAYALAYGCVENGVRCTLFLVGPKIPPQGEGFPENLVEIRLLHTDLKSAEQICSKYVQASPDRLLVPFGLNDPLYKNLLRTSFLTDPELKPLWETPPLRMWLAVGSGVILSVLLELLPQTQFMAVQVGKKVWLDQLTSDPEQLTDYSQRIKFYTAPERFTHAAVYPPPYSSLSNYDAKIWQFVLENGRNGDVIWNVARDYPEPSRGQYRSFRGGFRQTQ